MKNKKYCSFFIYNRLILKFGFLTLMLWSQTDNAYALKFRHLQNYEGLKKEELDADFRNYTSEGGEISSSQNTYFGSTISSQETKMKRRFVVFKRFLKMLVTSFVHGNENEFFSILETGNDCEFTMLCT